MNQQGQSKIRSLLHEKLKESMASVLPIVLIVMVICAIVVPIASGVLLIFLMGSVLLVAGMMLFTLGSEMSISPMGAYVGSYMTKSKKLGLILSLSFLLGIIITISEPDLQVLAEQVPNVPNMTLILSVAAGVGAFLVLALLRMLFRIPLPTLLMVAYVAVFVLAYFVPQSFRAVAFDSGGVTTGPMTVPFIMSLGVGVAAIRGDRRASDDSFGLVSMCSVGPILAVMILGMIFHMEDASATLSESIDVSDSMELFRTFFAGLPTYLKDVGMSLLPILIFMAVFQVTVLHIPLRDMKKMGIGLVYTYVGLVLFLTGANVGFMPAGRLLGQVLAEQSISVIIVPIGALMGYFIVRAEPAVYVLNRQVENMTNGAIRAESMEKALSIGVAASIGIAMIRVLTGLPILYFLLPGYAIALGISFFVPRRYTAIAFDSGGVASGPMTAAFLVPFAQGACMAVGGNLVTDAFGIVAMVAMTPLITIQVMGLLAERKRKMVEMRIRAAAQEFEQLEDDAIILL